MAKEIRGTAYIRHFYDVFGSKLFYVQLASKKKIIGEIPLNPDCCNYDVLNAQRKIKKIAKDLDYKITMIGNILCHERLKKLEDGV